MNDVSSENDPHPELPSCFRDHHRMKKLLPGIEPLEGDSKEASCEVANLGTTIPPWRPEALFRTCISSLATSKQFGRMMAAEADSRGFYRAANQAYVRDGLPYNWTIQRTHFSTFVPDLSVQRIADHLVADGVVRQGVEPSGQGHGKILERRSQRRSDPASPLRRVTRRRPSRITSKEPPRQSISPQRPPQDANYRRSKLKKSVPAPWVACWKWVAGHCWIYVHGLNSCESSYTATGEEWHICSFNAQPEAPARFGSAAKNAGASGWALNESISAGSGIQTCSCAPIIGNLPIRHVRRPGRGL